MSIVKFLASAFSFNMLTSMDATVKTTVLNAQRARGYLLDFPGYVSAIGHASSVGLFGALLGMDVTPPEGRMTVKVGVGEAIIVGQYSGPRLEVGVTTLPEGATIIWLLVEIID